MLWLPFAYLLAPYWLANRALIGTLKHYNVNLALIPDEATREVSGEIIRLQKLTQRRNNVFKKLYDLQILTDFYAINIKEIMGGNIDLMRQQAPEIIRLMNILKKHHVLSENKEKPKKLSVLYFKNNESAFEIAATMHSPAFSKESMSVGIVRHIDTQAGSHCFVVELAGSDEPLYVMGFNEKNADSIKHDDLVYWGFVSQSEKNIMNIKAVGHILATLKPEFNPNTREWAVKNDFT